MPYTVYRPDGNTKAEFQTYVRLLRQSGIDIGNLPRTPDPVTGKNWLYVWNDRAEAEEFRRELSEQVANGELWSVEEVDANPSVGPLGPIRVRMIRDRGEVVFTVDLLSRHLVRSAFPNATGIPTLSMAASTFNELRKARKDFLHAIVTALLPALTGLTMEELRHLGYEVIDSDTNQPVESLLPAELSAPAELSVA